MTSSSKSALWLRNKPRHQFVYTSADASRLCRSGISPEISTQCFARAVYLHTADKSPRLPHRPSKGQKDLYERALLASQRPSEPWGSPRRRPCGHTDPASTHGHPSLPLLRSLPHTPAGCGHGGTRKSSTSYSQNIRTRLPAGGYAPTIAHTAACLPSYDPGYSPAIWTTKVAGERGWTGNTCWRISLELSIKSCWYATSIWSRRIASSVTKLS